MSACRYCLLWWRWRRATCRCGEPCVSIPSELCDTNRVSHRVIRSACKCGAHATSSTRSAGRVRHFTASPTPSGMRTPIAEQFLAFPSEETASHGNYVIAFLEHQSAGYQASSPFVIVGAALAPICGNVFLRHAVNDRANPRPYAGAGAHRARLVRRVENKVRQVAAVSARHILQRFQFDVLDARSRSLDAVTGAGDDDFAPADQPRYHRADGIVTAIARALGFRNCQFHELPSRLV